MAVVVRSPWSRRRPRRSLRLVIGLPLLAMAVTAGCWHPAQVSGAPEITRASHAAPTGVAVGAEAVPVSAGAAAVAGVDVTASGRAALAQVDLVNAVTAVMVDPPAGPAAVPAAPVEVPATGADRSARAQRAPPAQLA